ncbi:MAG: hypothetical protein GTO41_08110 [Burkholderiales bacterium]|nr:hypothetical protein [Burkholderiales bacterium]
MRPSTEADHRLPKGQGGDDSMDNLAGKCKACHSRKTARVDTRRGGAGRFLSAFRS